MLLTFIIGFSTYFTSACTAAPDPVENGVLNLTFTGDSCVYEGPELLKAGPITLNFYNEGDMQASNNFVRHLEGKTHQDMLDQMGGGDEPSIGGHAPPWTEELGTWELIKPDKHLSWERDLTPGLYTLVCARITGSVWYGVGLTVVE
jgi:hypothetical protein